MISTTMSWKCYRLDDLLDEIEKRGIKEFALERFTGGWQFIIFESCNFGHNRFFADDPGEATAKALLWIIKQHAA